MNSEELLNKAIAHIFEKLPEGQKTVISIIILVMVAGGGHFLLKKETPKEIAQPATGIYFGGDVQIIGNATFTSSAQ